MKDKSLCGAVLISPRFVLTAAHCQDADRDFVVGPHTFDELEEREIPVVDRTIHPLYDSITYENDVAIFELEADAMIIDDSGEIVPAPYVKLSPDIIDLDGSEMTVIGFGDIDPDEKITDFAEFLRRVDVEYVGNVACGRDHRGEITDSMMCAEAPGRDACYGDSGGPLLLTPSENFEDDGLVGIVSWGRGCADEDYPGVYTRISSYYDWIVESMCLLNMSKAPSYVNCYEILGLEPEPTEAPTISPTSSPTKSPTTSPPVCRERGEQCVENADCCSDRCNVFSKTCFPPAATARSRLSSGRGGSAGGNDRRSGGRTNGRSRTGTLDDLSDEELSILQNSVTISHRERVGNLNDLP